MRFAVRVAMLTALWILAWGELSAANLASGIAVSIVLLVAFPSLAPGEERVHLRPVAAGRLGWYVVTQLAASNVVMTREILRRRPSMQPGVLRHQLDVPSEHVVTVMTSIISLSPGTMTVEVGEAAEHLDVHFLFLHDVDMARVYLEHLERLVTSAITADAAQPSEAT